MEVEVVQAVEEGAEGEVVEPETKGVIIPIGDDIIGNTPAIEKAWETQQKNGTCAAMAVGAVLKENGTIEDQWQVLIDGTRLNTIMSDNDEMAAHVQSNGNHVVWLSDVATGDPDNPVFTVIDSTVPGGKRTYNIRQIIAAAEDGEFTYISAGPKPVFLQMSGSYASIAERTEPEYSTWAKEAYQAAQRHASGEDRANSDRPDEVPLPVITNEQAKAITGKNSVAEAWSAIYTLDLAKIHKYPDLVSALPNRAPFSELSHMVTNLNMAKSSIYRALGFSEATVQSLLRDLDIE